jgi:hypothetical protein
VFHTAVVEINAMAEELIAMPANALLIGKHFGQTLYLRSMDAAMRRQPVKTFPSLPAARGAKGILKR